MFRSLGLDPSRMVKGTRRAKILYMPPASTCGRSIAFNGHLLSLQFRNAIQTPPQPRNSIVVIKRTKSTRRFKNHDQICQMLQRVVQGTDIKVEIFSDKKLPTFQQSMAIFNRAFMVIGPHGAGETNLFFSEEGTVNLECLCIRRAVNLCYRNLMRVLGHRYYGLYPVTNCNDTKPEQLEDPVRRYINDLYLKGSA